MSERPFRYAGQVLGEALRANGLRASEVAATAGINPAFLSRILDGQERPGVEVARKLVEAAHVAYPAALTMVVLWSMPEQVTAREYLRAADPTIQPVPRLRL